VSTGISGLGTGVATALAVAVGSAGAPVLFNGAGGTPSSMVGSNISGIPDGALSANVALLNAANVFTGANTFSTAATAFTTANGQKVGIGIASPSDTFVIVGNVNTAGFEFGNVATNVALLQIYDRTASTYREWKTNALSYDWNVNGSTDGMSLSSAGLLTVPSTSNAAVNIAGALNVGGQSSSINAGDISAARSTTSGYYNLGTDGAVYLARSGTTTTMTTGGTFAVSGLLTVSGGAAINDKLAVGAAIDSSAGLYLKPTSITGTAYQYGMFLDFTTSSTATGYGVGGFFRVRTPAAAFTVPSVYGVYIDDPIKGAGSTITTAYGLYVESQTSGSTNYAILTNGSAASVFGGDATFSKSGSGSSTITLNGAPSANGSGYIKFVNSNSVTNWQLSTNFTVGGAFEITPSTTGGGSTFTTSVFQLSSAGAVTITSAANSATISVSDWIYAPGIDGGTGTNVVLTAGGYIVADTSTERTKKNITRKWKPQAGIIDALYALEPIKYDYIETPGKGKDGKDAMVPGAINIVGFSAEELFATGATSIVNLDADGLPYSIKTNSLIAYQHMLIQDLNGRVKALEAARRSSKQ